MGVRDSGLKAASGVARKVRGSAGAAGGERKGQHSIEFKKSFGQHILKNPLVRARSGSGTGGELGGETSCRGGCAAVPCTPLALRRSSRPLPSRRLWTALWKRRA